MQNKEINLDSYKNNNNRDIYSQLINNEDKLINEALTIAMTTERDIDPRGTFYAEFSDGYTFRNLFEYLRLTNLDAVIKLYPDRIIYEQMSEDQIILNKFIIKTHELTDYQFSSATDEIIVSVSLVKFRGVSKNIAKKDRCSIFKEPDNPTLYVQIFNANNQSNGEASGIFPVETQEVEITEYQDTPFQRSTKNPNCTIYQGEFAKMCTSMLSVKSSHVNIHCLDKGVIFKGAKPDGSFGYIKDFGKVREEQNKMVRSKLNLIKNINTFDNMPIRSSTVPAPKLRIGEFGELARFSIPMDKIRALSKLHNISPMGAIKIYAEDDKEKPLRLICNIGSYGKLYVYIRHTNI
jgi:hypothetical protein